MWTTWIKFLKHEALSSSIHEDYSIIIKITDPKGTLKDYLSMLLTSGKTMHNLSIKENNAPVFKHSGK